LELLRGIREESGKRRQALEGELAEGVEGRSFARDHRQVLLVAKECLASVRDLIAMLSPQEGVPGKRLVVELRLLEEEQRTFRDLLAKALRLASEPPHPVDWARVRAAEEAYARGETKPFSRR
jgi:hypothetical protein